MDKILEKSMMEWLKNMLPYSCVLGANLILLVMKGTLFVLGFISILCRAQIAEGKDNPQTLGQKEYKFLGKTISLMLRRCRPIF